MNIHDDRMKDCAIKILTDCLGVTSQDYVLVIFDKFGAPIAEAFSKAALGTDCNICLRFVSYEEQKRSSDLDRYLNKIQQSLSDSNVLIFTGTDSDQCTRFRIKVVMAAVENESKIIHMPGVTDKMFINSTYGLDFLKLHESGKELLDKVNKGEHVEILTKARDGMAHKLQLSIKGRKAHLCGGIAEPGEIMNIPTGEVYIAPIEGSAKGSLVLNGSGPNCVFRASEEVILYFHAGILDIEKSFFPDNPNSIRLREEIVIPAKNIGIGNVTVGELGIGLNTAVESLTGNAILDEKAAGTAHIALGANTPFGGNLDCEVHHDLIFIPTSVLVDEELLRSDWKRIKY